MLNKLSKLLDVRSILTLSLTAGFLFLTFNKVISTENYMMIFSLVIGFYFSKEAVRDSVKRLDGKSDGAGQ